MASSDNDPPSKVSPYSLHETQQEGTGFRSKANDIFGSLGGLEQKYADGLTKRVDEKKRGHDSDDEEKEEGFKKPCPPKKSHSRGQESSFSQRDRSGRDDGTSDRRRDFSDRRSYDSRDRGRGRFSRPYNRRSHTPDYKVHPDKWQKYSLEDTCMYGDTFNRNVAMDFISDLRKRKEGEKDSDEGDASAESCSKIEFHKPTAASKVQEDDSNKCKNYGQVYRMSEYVVGMSKKPKSRHLPKASTVSSADDKTGASSNLSLGHLAEEEDMESADSSKVESVEDTHQSEDSKDSNQPIAAVDVETEGKESQNEPENEKVQFKSGKGKGKRKIRRRQSDDDDD